jgi:predicted dehydrogenase
VIAAYEEVLRDSQIDAAVLATPHAKHHEQIVAAAKAGKHAYVEKPLTLIRASAEQAIDACRRAEFTMSIGFNRRHAPSFVEMLRRIRAGDIGDVLHVEAYFSGPTGYGLKPGIWRSTRVEAPGGGMTARGIHTSMRCSRLLVWSARFMPIAPGTNCRPGSIWMTPPPCC